MHLQNAQYYFGIWKGARDRLDWVTHSEKKQMEKTENTRKGGGNEVRICSAQLKMKQFGC